MFDSLLQRSLTTSPQLRQRKLRFPHVRRGAKRRRIAKRRPLFFACVAVVLFAAVCVIGAADWEAKKLKIVDRTEIGNVKSESAIHGAFSYNGEDLELNLGKGNHTFGIASHDPSQVTFKYGGYCNFSLGLKDHLVKFVAEASETVGHIFFAKLADPHLLVGSQTVKLEKDKMIMGKDSVDVQNGDATNFDKGRFLRIYRSEAPMGCDVTVVFPKAFLAVLKDTPTAAPDHTFHYIAIGLSVGFIVIVLIGVIVWFIRRRAAKKAEKGKDNEIAKKRGDQKAGPKAEKKDDTHLALETMPKTTIVKPTKREENSPTKTKEKMPTKSKGKTTIVPTTTNNCQQNGEERSRYDRRPPHLAQEDVSSDAKAVIETKLPADKRKRKIPKAENDDDLKLVYELERDDENEGEQKAYTKKKSVTKKEAPKVGAGATRKSSTRTAVETQAVEKPKKKHSLLNAFRLPSWGKSSLTVDKTQEDAPDGPPAAEGLAKK